MKVVKKEKELSQFERMCIETPQLLHEHDGAYGRRIRANLKEINLFEKLKFKAESEKKEVAPKSFLGNIIEKVFVEPFWFVKKLIVRVVDAVIVPVSEMGTASYTYLTKEDERNGTNKYLQIKNERGIIVCMAKVTVVKSMQACIKWKGSKADKAKQATTCITKAGTSTYVTVPPLTITGLLTLATNYLNSDSATEEATFTLLNNGMKALMRLFQAAADLSPSTSIAIIESGGFSVRAVTPRKQQPWAATNSPVLGTIDLTANGAGPRTLHDWWISYDGVTFERLEPTITAHTQVSGLASGISVYFLHQVINSNGAQGFDLPIKKIVGAE
jgi:hypothetical protein